MTKLHKHTLVRAKCYKNEALIEIYANMVCYLLLVAFSCFK